MSYSKTSCCEAMIESKTVNGKKKYYCTACGVEVTKSGDLKV